MENVVIVIFLLLALLSAIKLLRDLHNVLAYKMVALSAIVLLNSESVFSLITNRSLSDYPNTRLALSIAEVIAFAVVMYGVHIDRVKNRKSS